MPKVSLLKKVTGSWEQRREDLRHDLQKLQVAINTMEEIPTFLPPRSVVSPSGPTPAINSDLTDFFVINNLAEDIKSFSMNLSGQPVEGQELTVRIIDNGTPRMISWGSSFASREGTLPTTTTPDQYLYIQLIWNTITSTWDCLAAGNGSTLTIDASQIISGTISTARLGSGTANSTTFLSGDQTYKQVSDAQVASAAAIAWSKLSKTGSSLADLTTRSATDLSSGTLADARLSANVPLDNIANTFSHTGNNFPDLLSPKFYFNAGIALNALDLTSVANNAINPLSIDGITDVDGILFLISQGTGGFHFTSSIVLRGSDHSTLIAFDTGGGAYSTTKGTATKINVYWDVGNARYEIENKSTITLRIGIIYLMLRN